MLCSSAGGGGGGGGVAVCDVMSVYTSLSPGSNLSQAADQGGQRGALRWRSFILN